MIYFRFRFKENMFLEEVAYVFKPGWHMSSIFLYSRFRYSPTLRGHFMICIWGKLPYDDGDGNGDSATVKAWVRQERSGRWKNHPIGKFGTNLT